MLYHLYGADEVARDEFLERKLVDRLRALPGGEFNLDRFDGRTAPLSSIIACCQAVPFLADKRMVIVGGLSARARAARAGRGGRTVSDDAAATAAEGAADGATDSGPPSGRPTARRGRGRTAAAAPSDTGLQELWDFLPNLPESTHLVLVDERALPLPPLPPKLLYRQEFEAPKPWKLAEWVSARARGRKLRLDRGVADTLANLVGGDLRRLDGELVKLALYCGNQPVREADVRLLVAPGETSVFALLDGVADGKPGAALTALRHLRAQGQAVEALLPQISALIRRLLIAHALLAEGRSLSAEGPEHGLTSSPRALEKLARQAARFSAEDFERAYERLLACDRAIKTGEGDPEVAIELLIAELAGVAAA